MLEVKIDTVTVSKGEILLGCTVKGPEGSWLRFVMARFDVHLMDYETICKIMDAWDVEPTDDPLQPTLPYNG